MALYTQYACELNILMWHIIIGILAKSEVGWTCPLNWIAEKFFHPSIYFIHVSHNRQAPGFWARSSKWWVHFLYILDASMQHSCAILSCIPMSEWHAFANLTNLLYIKKCALWKTMSHSGKCWCFHESLVFHRAQFACVFSLNFGFPND